MPDYPTRDADGNVIIEGPGGVKKPRGFGGPLVMTIGSSILAQGFTSSAARFGYAGVGPMEWARIFCKQRFMYRNAAVSGQTSDTIKARLNADVLAYNPDVVVIQNGTNEIGLGFGPIWEDSVEMYDKILATRAMLVVCGTMVRNKASSGWDDDNLQDVAELNQRKRGYCNINRNARYVQLDKYIIDPEQADGEPLANMLRDGTHFSNQGAFLAGQALYEVLNEIIPHTDVLSYSPLAVDGVDLIHGIESTNPLLAGTGGTLGTGMTGVVPDSWKFERTGGGAPTAVCSKVTTGFDPTNKFQAVITPSGAAGDEEMYFYTSPAGFSPADSEGLYEGLIGIEVEAWDEWQTIQLEVDDIGSVNKTYYDLTNIYDEAMPTHAWSGILRTPIFASEGDFRIRMRIAVNGDGTGTGTIRLFNPQVRRVNPDFLPAIYDKIIQGVDNKLT